MAGGSPPRRRSSTDSWNSCSRRWSWRPSSARYDRAMAAAIISPALDRLPGLLTEGFGFSYQQSTVIKALAIYDPRAVAAMVRDLPASARKVPEPSNGWQGASIDAQIRLAAAEVLGLSSDERYRKVLGGHLGPLSFRPTQ